MRPERLQDDWRQQAFEPVDETPKPRRRRDINHAFVMWMMILLAWGLGAASLMSGLFFGVLQ